MAAKRPMMAMTIMISSSVKADGFLDVFFCTRLTFSLINQDSARFLALALATLLGGEPKKAP